jgi:hypothetical protein
MSTERLHRWENTDRQRYYLAHLHVDLLGDIVISSYWGGLHSRLGGQWHEKAVSDRDAESRLESISRTRSKHGYRLIDSASP